jgi:hypothetical protein
VSGFIRRGGRRVDSPRERNLASRIDRAIGDSAESARALTIHASPYTLEVTDYLRAAAGPPAWSQRLARIQQLTAEMFELLGFALVDHRARYRGRPLDLQAAWRQYLDSIDLEPINELIDKHNLYYPTEARLRMQWPSGRYILPSGMEYPLPRLSVANLLTQFPCEP